MGIRKIIRNSLENYFKIKEFVEEGKKKKKKSKKPYYSTATMQTPTGSIFYMDAAVGENALHEVSAAKVLPMKFNHLKWKLNEEQKHFLDDFVNIHPDTLRDSDYKYASKRTGIPEGSLKSIQNTYGGWNKPKEVIDNSHGRYAIGEKPITAKEYEFEQKYRNDVVNFKTISKDQADALRYPKKTKKQKEYESNLYKSIKGGIQRSNTLKEVKYDDWAMYYIIGKLSPKDGRINEQKKIVEIDFEPTADYNDFQKSMLNSNKKSKYWIEVEKLLEEFNEGFGTTFQVVEQYDLTNSKSKCIRLVIEELNVGEKMLWDSTEKRYVKWAHAPIDLKKQYLNNRPEKIIKPIQPVDHEEMLNKYLGFDPSMFKGI